MSHAPQITFRTATLADMSAVETLLQRSYPALLKSDYPPSTLVTALPLMTGAQSTLLDSGRYWLAEWDNTLVAAGGWSHDAPGSGTRIAGQGHVRHVATHPDHVRRGLGWQVMGHALAQARTAGLRRMLCLSTRTAVPFYETLGFTALRNVEVPLRPGIVFPAIEMRADLTAAA